MSDEELALKASRHFVEFWESIPKRVDDFCHMFGESHREMYQEMLTEGTGGEEMYKTSKAFLASRGHVLVKIVDIPGPSKMLMCSHGIHRGDYCSECKHLIGEE
jgi:methionyl-tRNA synthetase